MPGFLKGINLAAAAGALILGAAAICFILYLQSRVSDLSAELGKAKADIAIQTGLVESSVKSCNAELSKIKTLEIKRRADAAEIKGLADRLATLPKDPPHDQPSSFADELNRINGDANRMLERSSRK